MQARLRASLLAFASALPLVVTTGCSPDRSADPNTNPPGDLPVPRPMCASYAVDPTATFDPAAFPDLTGVELVAATPHAIFASTGHGLHRSLDEGATFSLIDAKELRDAYVQAIASLGGDVFVSYSGAGGSGLLRSSDGGATWTDAASGGVTAPGYLSASHGALFASDLGVVYRWDAGASTWQALPASDQAFDVVEFDGANVYANSIYQPGVYELSLAEPSAGWTQIPDLPLWGYLGFAFDGAHGYAAHPNGLFESTDGGATWSAMKGLDVEVDDLLVTNGIVFAATPSGLRVSSDAGASWQSIATGTRSAKMSLAASADHVFLAGGPLLRAAPTAVTADAWTPLSPSTTSIDALDASRGAVFARAGADLLRSTDGGATWSEMSFDGATTLSNLAVRHGASNDTVFAFAWRADGGVDLVASTDDGATFERRAEVSDGTSLVGFLSVAGDDVVYDVMTSAGAGCSDAQGVNTTLYRSTDDGFTFSEGMNGFPKPFTDCYGEPYGDGVTGVVEAGGALFATSFGSTYRSTNGGAAWSAVTTPAEVGMVSSIVDAGGALVALAGSGLLRSTDGGLTWSPAGFDGERVTSLVRSGDTVFAGISAADPASSGVYASTDRGLTWARIGRGFDGNVAALAVQGGRVFAGTSDDSLWVEDLGCTR